MFIHYKIKQNKMISLRVFYKKVPSKINFSNTSDYFRYKQINKNYTFYPPEELLLDWELWKKKKMNAENTPIKSTISKDVNNSSFEIIDNKKE